MDLLILVDEQDREIGQAGKMAVHENGWLHRAFSIFIFSKNGDMLLQRRALDKYHSGGLWTNACCSHPRPGESIEAAAARRLKEELGFETGLKKQFHFVYRAEFGNGLTEHEYDHVLTGEYEGIVPYNKEEVMEVRYFPLQTIEEMVAQSPGIFTPWFLIALPRVMEYRDTKLPK